MKNTFEEYLQTLHSKHYSGTDDDMPDAFERFVENMQVDEWLEYAELWGKIQRSLGLLDSINLN